MSRDKRMATVGTGLAGVFLTLLALMGPGTASAAYDTYICIEGIQGDYLAKVEACPGGKPIEVVSWSFGVGSPVDTTRSAGGAEARVSVTPDFKFVMRTGKASPTLFQYATTRKSFRSAVLTARKPGDKPQDFLKITLGEVVISSFLNLGNSKSAEPYPMEEITLKFNKIEIECWEYGTDGSRKGSVRANWDVPGSNK